MNLQLLWYTLCVFSIWTTKISGECILPTVRHYAIPATFTPPKIDGNINDLEWANAPWTEEFVDILDLPKAAISPPLKTRAKMLWDDEFIYVAAQLFDPFIVANLTVMPELQGKFFKSQLIPSHHIYMVQHYTEYLDMFENTFEMLIDTDRTHHQLKRIQINPLGIRRSIQYDKPPIDGGIASVWKMDSKFESAVSNTSEVHQLVNGALNKVIDIATGLDTQSLWTIEWAIPISSLKPRTKRETHSAPPYSSFQFLRSGWPPTMSPSPEDSELKARKRRRRYINPAIERLIPRSPYLQAWSPAVEEEMLEPETWATIEFLPLNGTSNLEGDSSYPRLESRTRFTLMQIYRAQKELFERIGSYTDILSELNIKGPPLGECSDIPIIEIKEGGTRYEVKIYLTNGSGRVGHIRQDRYLWFDTE
ncbi:hypothetical protein K7432_004785 [Basidiobolus ranarum]|uniref:Uncharacterized protein n=1 Tax=Basidiobolus ranarum TaxID=34480 RepID=A0ABR2WXM6_9FUNG